MLITTFSQVASTRLIMQAVRFSKMSSPSTSMTQEETCLIKSWKENRDWSCKVFFHVPHFVHHQSAVRSSLPCCPPCISATSTPRGKALILTLRAVISQEVDLVAEDFNGTAWQCRSEDNLRTIDEAFTDFAFATGPHTVVVTRIHSEQLGRRLRISQTTGFSPLSGKCMSMVHSPFHRNAWLETNRSKLPS